MLSSDHWTRPGLSWVLCRFGLCFPAWALFRLPRVLCGVLLIDSFDGNISVAFYPQKIFFSIPIDYRYSSRHSYPVSCWFSFLVLRLQREHEIMKRCYCIRNRGMEWLRIRILRKTDIAQIDSDEIIFLFCWRVRRVWCLVLMLRTLAGIWLISSHRGVLNRASAKSLTMIEANLFIYIHYSSSIRSRPLWPSNISMIHNRRKGLRMYDCM